MVLWILASVLAATAGLAAFLWAVKKAPPIADGARM
jgi:nitrogen fixation-related uncharacterized protein